MNGECNGGHSPSRHLPQCIDIENQLVYFRSMLSGSGTCQQIGISRVRKEAENN